MARQFFNLVLTLRVLIYIIYSGILSENEESFVKIGQSVMEKSINLLYLLMCNECSNMHINQQ